MTVPAQRTLFYQTNREKFLTFHDENPHVFARLVRLAKEVKSHGIDRVSIALLFERLRWEMMIETRSDDFKINNNHKPYYARLIIIKNPELVGLFEFRHQWAREHIDMPA